MSSFVVLWARLSVLPVYASCRVVWTGLASADSTEIAQLLVGIHGVFLFRPRWYPAGEGPSESNAGQGTEDVIGAFVQ